MANMSTAYGTVYAYAKTKENAERVLNVIHRKLGDSEYCTYINDCADKTLCAEEDGSIWRAASSFFGAGRWAYQCNVEELSEWLGDSMNELKSIDFLLMFEFDDYEPGFQVLYRATMTADHKAGDSKIEFEMSDYKNYDFTAKNLRDMNFEENVMDLNEPKDKLMKWFINEHGEEYADDIRKVFNDSKAWKQFKKDYKGSIFGCMWTKAEDIGWKERAKR
jgi:hypothetical protein